jgi:hypothetical protein
MVKLNAVKALICSLLICTSSSIWAQVNVFSEIHQMDDQRIHQITGKDTSSSLSFNLRSSSTFFKVVDPDRKFWNNNFGFELRNVGVLNQYNSTIGVGSNDGSLLPNVGNQNRVNVSLALRWKKLVLQLGPEFSQAENLAPPPFELDAGDQNYMARYYLYTVNKIDNYWRFGKKKIQRVLPGQSSLRYQNDNFSLGLSTENIWWGPSLRNSLTMSNNADQFPYFTFNTLKPLKTGVGKFEGQFIFGRLSNPKFEHPDHERMKGIWNDGIAVKDSGTRSLVGMMISWEPKWIPNLYVGIATSSTFNQSDTNRRILSFPLFTAIKPLKLGSFFLRYNLPKENAEVYLELGRADKMATPFNIIRDSIPMGYTAGVRKLVPIKGGKSHFLFGLEITRLELPDPRLIFVENAAFGVPLTNSWYTSSQVTRGYTNNGQVMGAWIGPGSNSQTIQLGWIKGSKRIIITGERVQHNNDFYYYNYLTNSLQTQYQNPQKHWADINATAQVQWNIRNLLLSGAWSYTSMINYRWVKLDGEFAGPSTLSDRRNTQIYASAVWFFNRNLLQ